MREATGAIDEKVYLKRYVPLPMAMDIIVHRRLALISPEIWEDSNDAHYIERYRERHGLGAIYAACFTTSSERRHHWKSFADGVSGVCLEFDRDMLVSSLDAEGLTVRHQAVAYVRADQARAVLSQDDRCWPFVKRIAYRDESEYRILAMRAEPCEATVVHLSFDVAALKQIKLSPCLPEALADAAKQGLRALLDGRSVRLQQSRILQSKQWKQACG